VNYPFNFECFFHFASVAGQFFPLLHDRRQKIGYVGRTAWAEAVMFTGGLWSTSQDVRPTVGGMSELCLACCKQRCSGRVWDIQSRVRPRRLQRGRQGSCQPIILN